MMKEIKAIVRPNRLDALRRELRRIPGFPGMTVTQCEGLTAPAKLGSAADPLNDFTPKVRIDIVAPDELCETIVEVMQRSGNTGQLGDGLIWETPVTAIHPMVPRV
jgi:nitrogen regulatory protein P-II 1